jgi:hypothetical protein
VLNRVVMVTKIEIKTQNQPNQFPKTKKGVVDDSVFGISTTQYPSPFSVCSICLPVGVKTPDGPDEGEKPTK